MIRMFFKKATKTKESCAAEVELARDFPALYASYKAHPVLCPDNPETWERVLRVAKNCRPVLDDLRERGLDLVRLDQYTAPGTDRRPIYLTVLEWLPGIHDPLTLTICLSRLTEPRALPLVKKNRELLLSLARQWNDRLRKEDSERTLAVLSQCVMRAALERDLPEILAWANDRGIPGEVRANYVLGLERFARKPGLARDSLIALVNDGDVGRAAVWALADACKTEALALLRQVRDSGAHDSARRAAAAAVKKIEARSSKVNLPKASLAMLPQGFVSTSIEFDTERVPELLSNLERELSGRLESQAAQSLTLSANQLRRGQRRFYILTLALSDGAATQLGFGLYAEDDDVIVAEVHFDEGLRDAVNAAINHIRD
jgi:hypothetical protein